GFGGEAGAPMLEHPEVRAVSFTGSTAVGRTIGTTAAKSFKHCSLELGGKNPMIVLNDANLDLAIEGALWEALERRANGARRPAALLWKRVFIGILWTA